MKKGVSHEHTDNLVESANNQQRELEQEVKPKKRIKTLVLL